MDFLDDPDNHYLDMYLSLDHMLVDLVTKDDTNKYNFPKKFSLIEFKKIFKQRYD